MHDLLLPRLADHMAAEDGPSDAEEEEKEVKRCRSTSTTPRSASASGTSPYEYDAVMGITPVEPHEAVRFEEGDNSEFQDAQENTGPSHGGYGSASLQECLDRMARSMPAAPATLHSGKVLDLTLLK